MQELAESVPRANLITRGLDETFVRSDAAGPHHFLSGSQGSVVSLTNGSGSIETNYSYDAFGKTATDGLSNDNTSQFTARENDGTGLYYYRARYYSPTSQRFLSEDPLGFDGGDINIYSYVKNSPTNYTDPSGQDILTVEQYDRSARGFGFSGRYSKREPDICGSGWSGPLVPDKIDFIDLTGPCQKHDDCYGNTCGVPKAKCDAALTVDILNYCDQMPVSQYYLTFPQCTAIALTYGAGVRTLAGPAYDRAQKDACK